MAALKGHCNIRRKKYESTMMHDVSDSQWCEGNEMLPGHILRQYNGSLTLCPLPACEVHGGCLAELLLLAHVCVSTQASCLPCLFTRSLPLIIINKYDDAHGNKKAALHLMCVLSSCL